MREEVIELKPGSVFQIVASDAVKSDFLWEELLELAQEFITHVLPSPRYPKPIPVAEPGGKMNVEFICFRRIDKDMDKDKQLRIGAVVVKDTLNILFRYEGEPMKPYSYV